MNTNRIYIALPVLNEFYNLESFINCLRDQHYTDFTLIACVNNYEDWWEDTSLQKQCIDNQQSLELLNSIKGMDIRVIDRSSVGMGWPKKKGGVGWARKVAMDMAASLGNDQDILISMDADTFYPEDYLYEVKRSFEMNRQLSALAIPYYHQLAGDETDRLILRYEIYMRHYLLNMLMIRNPYAFTAIGSAMASTLEAYKRIGGITPVKSGEDFYFIQKLVKYGLIGLHVDTLAYPSSRFSSRVLFGTGPALIKGSGGDWDSYPLHPKQSFEEIQKTFDLFPVLFEKNTETPLDHFIKDQFKTVDIWEPLRNNYKDRRNFVKACIGKVDGLRILQFLRRRREDFIETDAEMLRKFIAENLDQSVNEGLGKRLPYINFQSSSVDLLNKVRDHLFEYESRMRKERDKLIFTPVI